MVPARITRCIFIAASIQSAIASGECFWAGATSDSSHGPPCRAPILSGIFCAHIGVPKRLHPVLSAPNLSVHLWLLANITLVADLSRDQVFWRLLGQNILRGRHANRCLCSNSNADRPNIVTAHLPPPKQLQGHRKFETL